MKMALHKLSSAQKLFRRAVRLERSQPTSGKKLSLHLSTPVTTRKLSNGNRPTKNSRREQGKKRKPSMRHLWQRGPQRANKPNHRYLRKPVDGSEQPLNQQLCRVVLLAYHLPLQWRYVRE